MWARNPLAHSFIYTESGVNMRIKVRELLSKTARWMELLTAGCVILAIAVLTLIMLKEYIFHWESLLKEDALEIFLQRILSFVIGIEFVKMLIQHSPKNVIDVLIFATSRQMIVEHAGVIETVVRIAAIGLLFIIQKFFCGSEQAGDEKGPVKDTESENI